MFDLQIDGRMIRVRPQGAVWSETDGWIELERVQAKNLVETIQDHRVWENENQEPEDG
jgi:hypothetical protein